MTLTQQLIAHCRQDPTEGKDDRHAARMIVMIQKFVGKTDLLEFVGKMTFFYLPAK